MIYSTIRLSTTLILTLLFTSNIYSNVISNDLNNIDNWIKKKQVLLLKTKKTNTTQYMSLYDEIAELTISKNKLLLEMDNVDDIDTDKTCDLALEYGEVEFIKTEYYKTPFHDEVSKTLQNITKLYEQCHPSMAEKYLKSILTIKEHIYLKDSAEVAKAHDSLADYYHIYMANFQKAIKEYEEAKRIREKLYGRKDTSITENYGRLAFSLYYHGDKTDKAEKLLLNSIKVREKAFPNIDFPLYVAYMDIGTYYSIKDEYHKSIIYLKKSLTSFQIKVNKNYIVILNELSQVYQNQNDLNNALKFAEKTYKVSKEFYGSKMHPQVLEKLNRISEIKNKMYK